MASSHAFEGWLDNVAIYRGPIDTEALKAKGIESVVFDPAGNRPASGDYLSVMRANAEHLERVAQAVRARQADD